MVGGELLANVGAVRVDHVRDGGRRDGVQGLPHVGLELRLRQLELFKEAALEEGLLRDLPDGLDGVEVA